MSRKRLDEDERKDNVSIRLPKKMIRELLKYGGINAVIEQACTEWLKNKKDK